MQPKKTSFFAARLLTTCIAVAALLTACGGGGGNPGATGPNPAPPGGGGGSTPPATPVLSLALVDATGNATNSLSGAQAGTLRATVKTAAGAPVANAVVTFSPSDTTLVEITPPSALTDNSGVAVTTVKPASVTSAGALSISANSVINGATATGSVNLAVGAAPLTVGALSLTPAPAGPVPAFSTVQVNIPVTSGGQAATSVSGLTMTSLCVGDGTATLVQGSLNNGVQTATYTNKGCLRGNDTITIAIGNSSQSISLPVSPAAIGAINFVGSNLNGASIVLKGSGGLGRSESAQLTFQVVDQHNTGLAGVDVTFQATTNTGGLTVSPLKATTDAQGNVSTVVSSGTIPTPVRVVAEASRGGTKISGLSDTLTISTGLPIQRFMSMSTNSLNVEGWETDNETATVTVLMADQYGNPVSDGTAINFVTEGGAIGSAQQGACTTVGGGCSVTFRSQEFRPTNGRVTVLAYAQGIEDFEDLNGDGQYTCSEPILKPGSTVYRPLEDDCAPDKGEKWTDLADAYLDTGIHGPITSLTPSHTFDFHYDPAEPNKDLPFPYKNAAYSDKGDGEWGINYIRRSIEITFSGSHARMIRQVCDAAGNCRNWTAADGNDKLIVGVAGASCATQELAFRLFDENNNPMPSGTEVGGADATNISPRTFFPSVVPSTAVVGGTIHKVSIAPDTNCRSGSFSVVVETPNGVVTAFPFISE